MIIKSDVGNVADDEPIEAVSSEDMEIALERARAVEQADLIRNQFPNRKNAPFSVMQKE